MNETVKETGGAGPSHRGVEIGVAIAMAILALIGIYGSIKVGIGWGAKGPRGRVLPVLRQSGGGDRLRGESHEDPAEPRMTANSLRKWGQIRQVLAVVVPTAIYVAAIPVSRDLRVRPRC